MHIAHEWINSTLVQVAEKYFSLYIARLKRLNRKLTRMSIRIGMTSKSQKPFSATGWVGGLQHAHDCQQAASVGEEEELN